MSLYPRAARRLSLVAGSSTFAAGFAAAITGAAVVVAPAPAAAQTCTTATMTAPGPDTVTCDFWEPPAGASPVSPGISTVVITEQGVLSVSREGGPSGHVGPEGVIEPPTVVTFANPQAVLELDGYLVVGPKGIGGPAQNRTHESELRLVGVEEFRHSGKILLGGPGRSTVDIPDLVVGGIVIDTTDHWHDDILSLPGATWVGAGGSVWFDVDTNGVQETCGRDPVNGDLAAADCLMLVGGATEGTTYVHIVETLPGDRGRLTSEGILLIDVRGGISAQGHFLIDPASEGYSPDNGGSLDKGMFQYVIAYNEEVQQHRLYSILSGSSHQMPLLASAAQSLWRLSTGTSLERQTDLRGDIVDGLGGGIWMRAAGEYAGRDHTNVSTAGGQDFVFDNGHEQTSYAITGGLDLVSGTGAASAYVLGVMAGYANAEVGYEASRNSQIVDGWTLGAYASYLSGGLFVDAAVNAANVNIRNDTPSFNFFPAGSILTSRATLLGAQIETGWRLQIAENFFVEPIASLSYVRGGFEDVSIRPDDASRPGLAVLYDDPISLRGSVGSRIALKQNLGPVTAQFSLLGRIWSEFEGENVAAIHNLAFPDDADAQVIDDFSGTFNEFAVGTSLYGLDGALSGFFNFGGKFGDDYESQNLSAGVRVNW